MRGKLFFFFFYQSWRVYTWIRVFPDRNASSFDNQLRVTGVFTLAFETPERRGIENSQLHANDLGDC